MGAARPLLRPPNVPRIPAMARRRFHYPSRGHEWAWSWRLLAVV